MTIEDKLAAAEAIWAAGPRKFSTGMHIVVPNHAIRRNHKGLPVSRFLPLKHGGEVVHENGRKIKVHPDGMRTDLAGRVIVDSKAAADRVCKVYGCERE